MEEEIEIEKTESEQENSDILNAEVGENESFPGLEAKDIVIGTVTLKTHDKKNVKMKNELVQVHCKHPDDDKLLVLTDIKWQRDDDLIVSALFVNRDKDGKFTKDSGIATLLSFMKAKSLAELSGKKMGTVLKSKDSKYLALRCY